MWTLEHLADVESDLSRFHRVPSVDIDPGLARLLGIDALPDLDGPRYFRLAERLFAYDGVLTARVRAELADEPPPVPQRPAPRPAAGDGDEKVVALSALNAMYPGVIERTRD